MHGWWEIYIHREDQPRNIKSSCPELNQNQNGTVSSDHTMFETELPSKYNFGKTVLPQKCIFF